MTKRALWAVAGLLLVSGLAIASCGDSGSDDGDSSSGSTSNPEPGCNADPWQCADGQTCWLNASGSAFLCMNSGPGQAGDTCQLIGGQVTCADDLICIMAPGSTMGTCTPFCDPQNPDHACPEGITCNLYTLQGVNLQLQACAPQAGTGGAGGGGGSGGSGGGAGGTGGAAGGMGGSAGGAGGAGGG